jgi:hypothetical protein
LGARIGNRVAGVAGSIATPEEVKKVETAIGASRAEQAREQMLN